MIGARLFVGVLSCVLAGSAATNQRLDVPFFQQEKNGCGAASVAMVMHYWGRQTPSPGRVYERLYNEKHKGILLTDMRRYLEDSGFRAFTLRGQWEDVERHLAKGRPIIVGLRKKGSTKRMHFAVLIGADGDHVWVNDPTRKKADRVKQAEFRKQWDLAERWMLLSAPSIGD